MNKTGFFPGDLYIPKKEVDLQKWCVVACDQYTSQPEYWEQVRQQVGEAPSTLHMIIPECDLEKDDIDKQIKSAGAAMEDYLQRDLLEPFSDFLYLRRTLRDGGIRRGLLGIIDLECYDFAPGSQSLVRATEGTVLERIPPRVRVRQQAALECPHVMLLIDDRAHTVIEPIEQRVEQLEQVYDTPLMQDSGRAVGYLCDGAENWRIMQALSELADTDGFNRRCGTQSQAPLLFAVGDGNHSLATAKTCYEQIKKQLSPQQALMYPARYALVEVVNLHDESLVFEPIHRVAFGVQPQQLLEALSAQCGAVPASSESAGQQIKVQIGDCVQDYCLKTPTSNLPVGTLQNFLDSYLAQCGGRVDYIHGEQAVAALTAQPNTVGFLLPAMQKEDLFRTVVLDGALPRKTFSMGHAWDKRFYLECRRIR
ncbi:DUF1015 domain-containing protein [Neobittarella massiliensis]|uniref:DUF1015 domain-containing protein n=1 Tax=Neobittarella massiliensis (ex Bilen et al. 2018) TaxID=2041842 RepID=UPI000CF6A331|nr:DUF1015 domain-containing protein [Neobittarella massiliensis]